MNCAEIRPLLHACADGELDPVRSLEIERHLKDCAACAAEMKSVQSLGTALRDGNLAYRAPDSLRREIRQIAGATEEKFQPREDHPQNHSLWIWKFIAATATAFAAIVLLLHPGGMSPNDRLMNEAVASHVRSLLAEHLTDVASSDRHTVKPWFDGKVDFAPDVKDFADQGFPLVGGRLDYLNGRTVAALVYRRDKHVINVFVWPAANIGGTTAGTENLRGYNVISRDIGGFRYCLVSDLEAKQLEQLAGLLGK